MIRSAHQKISLLHTTLDVSETATLELSFHGKLHPITFHIVAIQMSNIMIIWQGLRQFCRIWSDNFNKQMKDKVWPSIQRAVSSNLQYTFRVFKIYRSG